MNLKKYMMLAVIASFLFVIIQKDGVNMVMNTLYKYYNEIKDKYPIVLTRDMETKQRLQLASFL